MEGVPMRLPLAWLVVSIMATSAVLAGCSDDGGAGDAGTEIEVVASDFRFTPTELRVSANQQYELRLRNDSQLLHDWTIDAIPATDVDSGSSAGHDMGSMSSMPMMGGGSEQLHVAAAGKKTATLWFMPTQPGEYVYYCTVPGHRSAGMEGRLVVG